MAEHGAEVDESADQRQDRPTGDHDAANQQESRRRANHALASALLALWDMVPEERFGQFVMNLSRTDDGFADTWEWKHGAWLDAIQRRYEREQRIAASGWDVAIPDVPVSEGLGDPGPAPAGFRWVWAPDDRCRPATVAEHRERRCRRPRCGRPAVMALRRSNGWWLYCERHLYGRRIANGVVQFRKLVPEEGSS